MRGFEIARSRRAVCAFSIQLEAAMDTRDDEIEPIKNFVGIVEGAVGQDVGLDALEDPEFLAEALVEPVGFPVLLRRSPRARARRRNALTCEWSATPKY